MAYTSLATVKSHLGITSTSTDDIIATLITEAQNLIDASCGRTFEASSDTERTFDALRDIEGAVLYLDADLCAVTTVTNGDGVVVASDEYVTLGRNAPYYAIELLTSSGKTWSYTTDHQNAISVVGRWAYSTTAPAVVQQAARDLVTIAYRNRENLGDSLRPLMTGDGIVIMPDEYPKSFRALLTTHKVVI